MAQKSGRRTANKACLHCKWALFDTQMCLNCHAKKPTLLCKQGFFGDKSPFSSTQNAHILAFTTKRNSWNGTSRCQNFLLSIQYLHNLGGRASPPDNIKQEEAPPNPPQSGRAMENAKNRRSGAPPDNTKRVRGIPACVCLGVVVGRGRPTSCLLHCSQTTSLKRGSNRHS